jgi:hypothetical protein
VESGKAAEDRERRFEMSEGTVGVKKPNTENKIPKATWYLVFGFSPLPPLFVCLRNRSSFEIFRQ